MTIPQSARRPHRTKEAGARVTVLVLLVFLLGLGAAVWFYGARKIVEPGTALPATTGGLSEATLAILAGLNAPVEIRYYAILDPASVPDAMRAFAGRVDQLLAKYDAAANGNITVTRFSAESGTGAQAASAEGIKAFNLDKGDACFLGVAVAANEQKETLPQLSPEWEAALESDLSRAIARVSKARPAASTAAFTPAPEQSAFEEVKRALPNVASLTVEEGAKILRDAALKEAQSAAEAMQAQIQAAQQRLAQTRESGTEAEQQEALKNFQQAQAEQAEKLKAISARLQAQIAALKQMKAE